MAERVVLPFHGELVLHSASTKAFVRQDLFDAQRRIDDGSVVRGLLQFIRGAKMFAVPYRMRTPVRWQLQAECRGRHLQFSEKINRSRK